jgi:indole-3-glycerol phosphate synthase
LVGRAPKECTFIAESGLSNHADLLVMSEHGVRCFLVGESLMRQDDIEIATRRLLSGT